jgi:hypothetical protein
MLEGICHECGLHYHGLALYNRHNQICLKCGCMLQIKSDGVLVRSTCTSLRSEKYQASPLEQEEWEDLCSKNLLIYLTLN